MKDEMIEGGAVIGDNDGGLWRVLEVTNEGLLMLGLPERADVIHTRSVTWRRYEKSYELMLP